MNFSAQSSANQVQDTIESKLEKRRKGVLGPALGTNVVLFVDDLNLPAKEEYGAQPPIELLRQMVGQGGWYNRSENVLTTIVDCQLIAAMGPPGGGRSAITSRLIRYFHVLHFVPFDPEVGRCVQLESEYYQKMEYEYIHLFERYSKDYLNNISFIRRWNLNMDEYSKDQLNIQKIS